MTATDLPRPIDLEDIRVGDRIRAEWVADGIETVETATVAKIVGGVLGTASAGIIGPDPDIDAAYTLLDRPGLALPTEPGSVVLASRLDDVDYDPPVALALAYTSIGDEYDLAPWMLLGDRDGRARWYRPERIKSWAPARVVPADHDTEPVREPRVDDPASMWEVSGGNERCKEPSPIFFCHRPSGHDGPHAVCWDTKVQGVWS